MNFIILSLFFRVFIAFSSFFQCVSLFSDVFHSFFKELDFKELEIHRHSLLDTINEYQWISINEYQWISINEFIDGPSMNMVPFLWAPFFWLFFGLHWAAFGPHGARAASWHQLAPD